MLASVLLATGAALLVVGIAWGAWPAFAAAPPMLGVGVALLLFRRVPTRPSPAGMESRPVIRDVEVTITPGSRVMAPADVPVPAPPGGPALRPSAPHGDAPAGDARASDAAAGDAPRAPAPHSAAPVGNAPHAPHAPAPRTIPMAEAMEEPDTDGDPAPLDARAPDASPPPAGTIPAPSEPSLRDPRTGLATRVLFRDRLEHALLRAQRRNAQVAVVLLEFDGFNANGVRPAYDDVDALLEAIGRRLATWLRATDSAARLDGSRFALLLEDLEDPQAFTRTAERVAQLFASPLPANDRAWHASAFIGVACAYPEAGADQLMHHADVALRSARRRGRGSVELFDPRSHAGTLAHRHLDLELRHALERGEMSLAYQPIVFLRSRRIAGVEALVRWQHRTRGVIPAAAFIPVAEETGLIIPLGRWVLREACAQLGRWQHVIGPDRPLTLTVNVSARQLLDARLDDDVAAAIRESGIDPQRLVLEVSESTLARSVTDVLARLRAVRTLGVRLAIDDFGSRSGTIGDPSDIPVDILKIDRAFVRQVTRRAEDHAATRAIVALGRLKQLRTVAAGIEREDQLVELLRFQCEYGQGALFSDPVSADDLQRLLLSE